MPWMSIVSTCPTYTAAAMTPIYAAPNLRKELSAMPGRLVWIMLFRRTYCRERYQEQLRSSYRLNNNIVEGGGENERKTICAQTNLNLLHMYIRDHTHASGPIWPLKRSKKGNPGGVAIPIAKLRPNNIPQKRDQRNLARKILNRKKEFESF
jgi:hypothetical protein